MAENQIWAKPNGNDQKTSYFKPILALVVCSISYLVGNHVGAKASKKRYESRLRNVLIRVKTYEAQQKCK